jgi:transposase
VDWEKIRPRGFHVLKRRWVVERTFAWLSSVSSARQGL